ncbi:MAG: M48 family metalloprotease [Pseudomonadota bacterium]
MAAVTIAIEATLHVAGGYMYAGDSYRMTDAVTDYELTLRTGVIASGVLVFILLASLFRMMQLGRGGARIAQELGGTLVNTDSPDLARQRLRNVVEEMAIASGVPVPQIFVLEEEAGINAFAAGFSTADAAVAVTRGALEQLSRAELQGVIAHEFSHILNGDMRLNLRMIGVLFGIIIIGQIGRILIRSASHRRRITSRGRSDNNLPVIAAGIVLFLIGSLGVLMARMIRAGVSRQREFLADASAVQFTRQTEGIAGALAKIGQLDAGSRLREVDTDEVSHMLIAPGAGAAWFRLMASHPPIEARLQALDPSLINQIDRLAATSAGLESHNELISAFANQTAGTAQPAPVLNIDLATATERIGNPGDPEIAMAAFIRTTLPAAVYDASHSREWAFYLTLAIALDHESSRRQRQLDLLEPRVGRARCERMREYADAIGELGQRYRLPILELCFPSLKERPAGQLTFLIELVDSILAVPPARQLRDYAFRQLLAHSLDASLAPLRQRTSAKRRLNQRKTRYAAQALISILAHEGHRNDRSATRAFERGVAALGLGSANDLPVHTLQDVDSVLPALTGLFGEDLRSLINALLTTVSDDGKLTLDESELMRLIAAALHCPLPPLIDATLIDAYRERTQADHGQTTVTPI